MTRVSIPDPRTRARNVVNVVLLKPGFQNINLMFQIDVFGNMNETFLSFCKYSPQENRGWVLEDGTSETANSVPTNLCEDTPLLDGCAADLFFSQFDDRITDPTDIPTVPGMTYTRKCFGICDIAWADFRRTLGPYINGQRIVLEDKLRVIYKNITTLFNYLDQDEAMLFVVSQLCSQAGIPGVMLDLLSFTTKANKGNNRLAYPLWYNGRFINLIGYSNTKNTLFRDQEGIYRIETEFNLSGEPITQAAELMPCGFGDIVNLSPEQTGIQSMTARTTVLLMRSGNRITMTLIQCMLKVSPKIMENMHPVYQRLH